MPGPEIRMGKQGRSGVQELRNIFNLYFRRELPYPFELEGQDVLEEIKARQRSAKDNTGVPLPMIVYGNHIPGLLPTLAIPALLQRELDGLIGPLISPISDDYLRLFPPVNPKYALATWYGRSQLGLYTYPVVQSFRYRDMRLSPKQRQRKKVRATELGIRFIRRVSTDLKAGGCLFIMPEGHRAEALWPAEEGVGLIIDLVKNSNIIILPIASLSSNGRLTLKLGKCLTKDDVMRLATGLGQEFGIISNLRNLIPHALMIYLRDLLPPGMWGYYDPRNRAQFEAVLRGQLKLITDREGNIMVKDCVEQK